MTKDEALTIEALKYAASLGHSISILQEISTPFTIKEALAPTSTQCEVQDELCSSQEPVAWTVVGDGKFGEIEIGQHAEIDLDACRYWVSRGYSLVPLYTASPKEQQSCDKRPWGKPWVSLTDDEFLSIVTWRGPVNNPHFDRLEYAKAIEAKLKELNT